jgi:hypothetical protein
MPITAQRRRANIMLGGEALELEIEMPQFDYHRTGRAKVTP